MLGDDDRVGLTSPASGPSALAVGPGRQPGGGSSGCTSLPRGPVPASGSTAASRASRWPSPPRWPSPTCVSWLLLNARQPGRRRGRCHRSRSGFYVLAFNVSSWPMSAVGAAIRAIALPGLRRTPTHGQRNDGLVRSSGRSCSVAVLAWG